MDNNFNEHFRKRLAEIIEKKICDDFSQLRITENDIDVPIDFVIEYMTSIFIGPLHWWITRNRYDTQPLSPISYQISW